LRYYNIILYLFMKKQCDKLYGDSFVNMENYITSIVSRDDNRAGQVGVL